MYKAASMVGGSSVRVWIGIQGLIPAVVIVPTSYSENIVSPPPPASHTLLAERCKSTTEEGGILPHLSSQSCHMHTVLK